MLGRYIRLAASRPHFGRGRQTFPSPQADIAGETSRSDRARTPLRKRGAAGCPTGRGKSASRDGSNFGRGLRTGDCSSPSLVRVGVGPER